MGDTSRAARSTEALVRKSGPATLGLPVMAASTRVLWRRAEPAVWLDVEEASVAPVHERLGATETERQEVVVYDTRDLALRRAGILLSIELHGGRTFQRIAFPFNPGDAEQLVHETEVLDPLPDRRHLVAVAPPDIASLVEEAGLDMVFALRFTRSQGAFPAALPAFNIVLDRGVLSVRGTHIPFAELGLRNRGKLAATPAAVHFLADLGIRLAAEDRWERGFRIAAGLEPRPAHARFAPVALDASLGEAAEGLLRQAFGHFIRNLPAASLRGEAEAIHQMRVGLRRLRACASIFRRVLDPQLMHDIRALRRLFAFLAEVRECDVFLESMLPDIDADALPPADRSAFEVAVRLHRAAALGALRRAFDGRDLAVLVAALGLRLDGRAWGRRQRPLDGFLARLGATDFAVARIRSLHRKLIAAAPAQPDDVAGWHVARVRAKKLRYADPLLAALPARRGSATRYARRLTRLQDVLGDLNDLRTAGALVARLAETETGDGAAPMLVARNAVERHLAAHIPRLLPKAAARAADPLTPPGPARRPLPSPPS